MILLAFEFLGRCDGQRLVHALAVYVDSAQALNSKGLLRFHWGFTSKATVADSVRKMTQQSVTWLRVKNPATPVNAQKNTFSKRLYSTEGVLKPVSRFVLPRRLICCSCTMSNKPRRIVLVTSLLMLSWARGGKTHVWWHLVELPRNHAEVLGCTSKAILPVTSYE